MLLNPAHQHPSLAGFTAWLARQPAAGEYDWDHPNLCVCGRYFADTGNEGSIRKYQSIFATRGEFYRVCMNTPWTFGAALYRLRLNALADEPAEVEDMAA